MKSFQLFFLLLTECQAKESNVSYAWNSTLVHPLRPNAAEYVQKNPHAILGQGLSFEAHRLLKQGLKIGYLPPSRYNGMFIFLKYKQFHGPFIAG